MIARLRSPRVRAVLGSLGSSLWIQAFVLVSGIIAARLLGPGDRGYLALIWTVALVTTQVGSLGVPLAITYELAKERTTIRRLARLAAVPVAVQIAAATAAHGVLLVGLTMATDVPALPAWISLAVTPAILVQTLSLGALQGRGRHTALNVARTLPVVLYAVGLIVVMALDAATLLAATLVWVGGYVISAAVSMVLTYSAARAGTAGGAASDEASYREMVRFGLRGLLGWASPTETLRLDQLVVGLFLSAHSLGLYVAALAFTNLPRFFAQGLGLVAYPAVAKAGKREQRRVILRFTVLTSAVSLTTCGLLALVAEPMVTVAFGEAFAPAVGPLRILLLATGLLCVRRVLSDCLRGAGLAGAGSRAEALSWIVLLPSMGLLGHSFGINGVAYALCLTYAVSLAALWASATGVLTRGTSPNTTTSRTG